MQFGPLIMPGHKTLFVGNYILSTWSSSCPPPGVKLTSFKVNNWLQFVASEKWRAHQEIIVRGAGLGLVAGAGHPSRPLHPFPLLHQDQLQVITQHKVAPAQRRKSQAVNRQSSSSVLKSEPISIQLPPLFPQIPSPPPTRTPPCSRWICQRFRVSFPQI